MKNIVFTLLLISCLSACNSDNPGVNILSCCFPNSYLVEVNTIGENEVIDVFNVITPNGDGINDFLVIFGLDQYPNNSLKIFSEGELVFQATDYNRGPYFGRDLVSQAFVSKVFTYELLIGGGTTFKATGTICAVKSSGNNDDYCNLFDINDPLFD